MAFGARSDAWEPSNRQTSRATHQVRGMWGFDGPPHNLPHRNADTTQADARLPRLELVL
jgi:hypothetical protein